MKTLPMLVKPTQGSPCNGCGYCCREQVCGLGLEVLKEPTIGPCPFIVERAGRVWCGVIETAAAKDVAFGGYLAWRLGIGRGCDAEDEP
jgi:hypothetical protein